MFQTQEKPNSPIKTSVSIEQVQYKEKNYSQKSFETQKINDFPSIESDPKRQWTNEEENLMFELHNLHGNKWAIIADKLNGRSDNSIKNHFYSRLRKGLRKLNKIINLELKKSFKQFKIIDLYKVIEASDQKFKEIKTDQFEFANVGLDLKNRIFLFAEQNYNSTEETKSTAKKLINDLSTFTKDYKRKSKKNRRYSPMGTDSVYRAHIKGSIPQNQLNQKPINIEYPFGIQSAQQVKEQALELQKTPSKNAKKSFDSKNHMKKQVKQLQKELKKSEQSLCKSRTRSKKSFTHFSDDDEEIRDESEELRQQRLDNFAQNILKTLKSYISFQSFKSNALGDELLE